MDRDPVYLMLPTLWTAGVDLEETGGRGLGVSSRWKPKTKWPKEKPSSWLYVPHISVQV